jgi:hypothetical protein
MGTWGIKYKAEILDIHALEWGAYIEEQDITVAPEAMQPSGSPLRIEPLADADNLMVRRVRGTMATLTVKCTRPFQYLRLYNANDLTYRLSIFKGGNKITSWANYSGRYETFTSNGPAVTSAIETGTLGEAHSNNFTLLAGESITLMFLFTKNSGQLPGIHLWNTDTSADADSDTVAEGLNYITLTATTAATYFLYLLNDAATNFSFTDMFGFADSQLKFRGYLDSSYKEAYNDTPYDIDFTATDALGYLKNVMYDDDGEHYTGRQRESKILLDILGKIGFTEFIESVNIYEDYMADSVDDSPAEQTLIDAAVGEDFTCYDMLEKILTKWNALIRQRDGVFYIYRPNELLSTVYGRHFTAETTKSSVSLDLYKFIKRATVSSEIRDINGGCMTIIDPAKKLSLIHDYGFKDSWISNYRFDADTFDGTEWEGWTRATAGDYYRPVGDYVIGEKQGIALISDKLLYQDFGVYSKISAVDAFIIEFEYASINTTSGALSTEFGIDIYQTKHLKSSGDGLNAHWSATVPSALSFVLSRDPGWSGWTTYKKQFIGIEDAATIRINLKGNILGSAGDVYVCFRNIRFYASSTATVAKQKSRSFWQRLRISGGYMGEYGIYLRNKYYSVKERIVDEQLNIVEYTHERTNTVNGEEIELDVDLGDVLDTSSPAADPDVNIENIIEQFKGALAIYPLYSKAQAAENFDTDHSSAYPGITVTHSGDDVIFTEDDGNDFTDSTTIVNVSGDMSGIIEHTQAHITGKAAICTMTIEGTGGSVDISCNGETKEMAWYGGSVANTIDSFIANEGSAFVAVGVTLTRDGDSLIFTTVVGVEFTVFPNLQQLTGDLNWDSNGAQDTQDAVVAVVRIDTITLTGTSGTANIKCDYVTKLALLTGVIDKSSSWCHRGESTSKSLLALIADELGHQLAKPRRMLSLPIQETNISSNEPNIDVLGCYYDDRNVDESITDIRNIASWDLTNCTLALTGGYIRQTTTAGDPVFYLHSDISIKGKDYRYINIRYKVISGTPSYGEIFYKTAGHGYSASYYKALALISDGEWHTLILDMSSLDAGGTDWMDNLITNIRFDLDEAHPLVIDIDWVGFSRAFAFNRGSFDVKNRRWDIDLIEILR